MTELNSDIRAIKKFSGAKIGCGISVLLKFYLIGQLLGNDENDEKQNVQTNEKVNIHAHST